MLSEGEHNALIDIRLNIKLIEDCLGGFDFGTFERELKTVYATMRALEIISEASRRLPADLKGRHSGILWKEMQGAGNIYRQEYDGVEASLSWKTARDSLPPLLAAVEAELAAADRESRQEGGKE